MDNTYDFLTGMFPVFAVAGLVLGVPLWGPKVALRPVYRAGKALPERTRFQVRDLALLVTQLAIALAIAVNLGWREYDPLRPGLFLLFTCGLLSGMWMLGIRALEGAGVTSFLHRAVYLMLLQPVALLVVSVAVVQLVLTLYFIPDLVDRAEPRKLPAIDAAVFAITGGIGLILIVLCNFAAAWIVAGGTKKLISELVSSDS